MEETTARRRFEVESRYSRKSPVLQAHKAGLESPGCLTNHTKHSISHRVKIFKIPLCIQNPIHEKNHAFFRSTIPRDTAILIL